MHPLSGSCVVDIQPVWRASDVISRVNSGRSSCSGALVSTLNYKTIPTISVPFSLRFAVVMCTQGVRVPHTVRKFRMTETTASYNATDKRKPLPDLPLTLTQTCWQRTDPNNPNECRTRDAFRHLIMYRAGGVQRLLTPTVLRQKALCGQ